MHFKLMGGGGLPHFYGKTILRFVYKFSRQSFNFFSMCSLCILLYFVYVFESFNETPIHQNKTVSETDQFPVGLSVC